MPNPRLKRIRERPSRGRQLNMTRRLAAARDTSDVDRDCARATARASRPLDLYLSVGATFVSGNLTAVIRPSFYSFTRLSMVFAELRRR